MIIDNEKYTMADHIKKLCKHTKSLDIAVGYFYSDGFNLIEECLRSVDKVRIIMGQDTNQTTIDDIADADSLLGKYVSNGKIEIRIYETDKTIDRKYHGKTWIFHGTNTAIIGSSNCSINGLQKNKELNTVVDIKEVGEWYDNIWEKSTAYDYKKLKVMEKVFKKPEDPTQKPEITLEPFTLHEYQTEAIDKVIKALETEEKCKLIMACGTGKTLASIKIMEKIVSNDGVCVYFVPSISLIPQTLAQFKQNGKQDYDYHAVCSDSTAVEDDSSVDELKQEIKSSTDENELIKILKNRKKQKLKTPLVIFTVYNSYDKTNKALKKVGIIPQLILYDEAHRTAGKKDGFASKALHDVEAENKVFMTATPRTYKNSKDKNVNSMDNDEIYGHTAYHLSFTEAVALKKLAPFRIVLPEFKKTEVKNKKLAEKEKVRAMWKGIQYPNGTDSDKQLLQRVIAFHSTINASRAFAGKVKGNKILDERADDYSMEIIGSDENNRSKVRHVDSTMTASQRRREIDWLKDSNEDETECRILSNARCLQEGVDVPALDGVAFLDPKRSPVDIIQAIGRVMRKPKGLPKEAGYVILPIPTFSGSDIEEQMRKNPTYKMVSNVISAMLAHDDKLASLLNQTFLLNKGTSTGEQYTTRSFDEYLKTLICNAKPSTIKIIRTVMLDLVDKTYYPRFGKKLGKEASKLERDIITQSSTKNTKILTKLQNGLKILINDSISLDDARKVVCQHAVLRPVFDQLFPKSKLNNPVSTELDKTVDNLKIKTENLNDVYDSIKNELDNMTETDVKQGFIRELYDSFIEGNDGKSSDQLGIVYTPIEVIDFINHSVEYVLKTHFNTSFANNNVKVLDPFTGTGTFITRLLQSGIIPKDKLYKKYKNDVYANDVLLLAYYTARANIETTYSSIMHGNKYIPFNGILYSDTFAQHPKYRQSDRYRTIQQSLNGSFKKMHNLVKLQNSSHIHVIIGNPPYSGGQKNASDNNKNTKYVYLENKIKETYAKRAPPGGSKSLYNSYIKALRWASDRIEKSGIIAFVISSSFLTSNNMSRLRKCLYEEFTDIYCFDLQGNIRIFGEIAKLNGGNIFGSRSREGICVLLLIKNPVLKTHTVHYTKIKNYLTTTEKLEKIKLLHSIEKINNWKTIIPDKDYNWIDQPGKEDEVFKAYMPLGSKEGKYGKTNEVLFNIYSSGITTSRDVWVYNSSRSKLINNMEKQITYCNKQNPDNFQIDTQHAKWTRGSKTQYKRLGSQIFDENKIRTAVYRPFFKQYLYFDKVFNEDLGQILKIYSSDKKHPSIIIPDKIKNDFSTLLTDITPDKHIHETIQCFPLNTNINISKNNKVDCITPPPPPPPYQSYNLAIVVPDKISEFSVFLTNIIPDREVIHHGKYFPMKVMKT